jgi:hypothetical protein
MIGPGKPWQNDVTESFNPGKFRDECVSLEWFRSRAKAKVILEASSHTLILVVEGRPEKAKIVSRITAGTRTALHGAK